MRWSILSNVILLIAVLAFCHGPAYSAGVKKTDAEPALLIVGTKEAPPFSMKKGDGSWTGISIELWRRIARELDLDFTFRETDLRGLLDETANDSMDVAVAALTITTDREKLLDFTHSFHTTGLGIAIRRHVGHPFLYIAKALISPAFFKLVSVLILLLAFAGFLVWQFEKKKNPQQFGGNTATGLGSGFWWSAVTMTTVGYGDKAPRTLGGRLVALLWMFTSIILFSFFTATITSLLTVSQLQSPIKGLEELPDVRVVTVKDSTSEEFLKMHDIRCQKRKTADEGLQALAENRTDAVVYDKAMLRYQVNKGFKGTIEVLPVSLLRQDYGFALPEGSPHREAINRSLLRQIADPSWQSVLTHYLGFQ